MGFNSGFKGLIEPTIRRVAEQVRSINMVEIYVTTLTELSI